MNKIKDNIVLQKQYNDSYSATSTSIENSYNTAYNNYVTQSNSIATSYSNAYNDYVSKSNSIATAYNSAMNSYTQASTAISQANQAAQDSYNTALASYNTAMAKYEHGHPTFNKNNVRSSDIVQRLTIAADPNMKLTVSNVSSGLSVVPGDHIKFNGVDDFGSYINVSGAAGGSFTLTYSNISSITYKNRAITKVVYQVNLSLNDASKDVWTGWSTDLVNGFAINQGRANIKISMYYEDGTPVDFEKDTAYLAVASLNNYINDLNEYSVEHTIVNSGGTALGLYGSSVSSHNNDLYSDLANSVIKLNNGLYEFASSTKQWPDPDHTMNVISNAPTVSWMPAGWDMLNSSDRYFGAGLINLQGNVLNIDVVPEHHNVPTNAKLKTDMWWNASTVIPQTPGPTPPPTPTIKPNPIEPPKPDTITPPTKQNVTVPTKESVTRQYASATYHSNKIRSISS